MLPLHEAPSAIAASLLLGSTWRWPMALRIGTTYGMMMLAQSRGTALIGILHNESAAVAATAPPTDVLPDAAFESLCDAYEGHHWHSTSNCLHACGMLLVFGFLLALCTRRVSTWRDAARIAQVVPPTWYLYAWAGHFLFQADVPAVFTYGMTLRGWCAGELCSVRALFLGRTVGPWGANGAVGIGELLLTVVLLAAYVAAAWPAWRRLTGSQPKVVKLS